MDDQANAPEMNMELAEIPGTSLKVSPVAIGTWAIGGWMWGGTDEAESIATIRAAFEHGINVIDTAPVYGFGRSEEIVGKAIAEGRLRSDVLIATKAGLAMGGGKVFRNASRARIMREVEDSLRQAPNRLYRHLPGSLARPTGDDRRDRGGDAYAVRQGKIRAIGVSNFSVGQMERFRRVRRCMCCSRPTICSSAASSRPSALLPQEQDRDTGYGALCRGLLSGRMRADTHSTATIFAAPTRNS